LNSALLFTSDNSFTLQAIGQVGDTAHKLPVVSGALGAFRDPVGDGATTVEQLFLDTRVATSNDDRGAHIRYRALF